MRTFQSTFSNHLTHKNFNAAGFLLAEQCKKPLTPAEISDLNNILRDRFASNPDEMGTLLIMPLKGKKLIQLIAESDKWDIVTAMVQAHRAIKYDEERYGAILVHAASQKDWLLCRLLMIQGASCGWGLENDPSDKTKARSALHFFASDGQTELALQAIRLGADMTCRTEEGKTPIIFAYVNKKLDTVTAMVQAHRAAPGDKECYGTVLLLAAHKEKWDLCHLLMNQMASLSVALKVGDLFNGYRPLHFFILHHQTDLALQAMQLGADKTYQAADGKTPEQLAIDTVQWRLLTQFIAETKNLSAYTALFAQAAKAQEWEFCRALLLKEKNLAVLKNQRVTENEDRPVSAFSYFMKYGQHALAAHLELGQVIYLDEQPLLKLITHLYTENTEKSFDQLREIMCECKASEAAVRENIAKELLHGMDAASSAIYTLALTHTDDNFSEKYEGIRPGTADIDWALCGAIQQNCSDEANFLLDQGANLLHAWIGVIIAGKIDLFEDLKARTLIVPDSNNSARTSPVAMFQRQEKSSAAVNESVRQLEL